MHGDRVSVRHRFSKIELSTGTIDEDVDLARWIGTVDDLLERLILRHRTAVTVPVQNLNVRYYRIGETAKLQGIDAVAPVDHRAFIGVSAHLERVVALAARKPVGAAALEERIVSDDDVVAVAAVDRVGGRGARLDHVVASVALDHAALLGTVRGDRRIARQGEVRRAVLKGERDLSSRLVGADRQVIGLDRHGFLRRIRGVGDNGVAGLCCVCCLLDRFVILRHAKDGHGESPNVVCVPIASASLVAPAMRARFDSRTARRF